MTDVLDQLRTWEPPDGAPDPDAAGRARAALHAHIDAAPRAVARGRRARTRRPWWPAVAMAAAVAIAVAFLSLGWSVQEGRVVPTPATAAEVLEHAARAVEHAAERFPAPDEFAYVRSQGGNLSCVLDGGPKDVYCAYVVQRRELWQSFSRPGRAHSKALAHRWPTPEQRRRWIRDGRPPILGAPKSDAPLPRVHFLLGNDRLSYLELVAYRPTPAALYRRLRASYEQGQGAGIDDELFVFVADALRDQPVPAPLRASLYRALKLVPGVRLGGVVRDRLGRRALVVTRTQGDTRRELLFDPRSWAMIGEREVSVRRGAFGMQDAPAGTVLQDVVYEQRGVVDRIGARPPR